MAYGSAVVTPSSNEVPDENEKPSLPEVAGLISVQSDTSVLSKKRSAKHRRHKSMFSLFASDILDPQSAAPGASSKSAGLRKTVSGKLKWDWKLGELWHTRKVGKNNLPSVEPISIHTDSSMTSSTDSQLPSAGGFDVSLSATTEGVIRPSATAVRNGEGSLHYTSLGLFTSSKFSSSDLDSSDQSGSQPEQDVEMDSREPLARRWREIQGMSNWEGLLDPLDLDLREELLRYGDFTQMTYDNFECNKWSKYAGSARFPKAKLFEKLHKPNAGYQVTRYLYSTCENPLPGILQTSLSSEKWDVESNWQGFVAVATDAEEIGRLGRRDILISWRGTMRSIEWLVDAQIQLAPMTLAPDPQAGDAIGKPNVLRPKVEKGFWGLYTCKRSTSNFNKQSASEQVMEELTRLLTLYGGDELSITITGHSLGGALAILTAYEIAEKGLNKQKRTFETPEIIPVTVFSFGSPHIGDAVFKKRFEELQLKALRVVNVHDLVPKAIGGVHPPWSEAYKHVGVELQVNHRHSTYMKRTSDPLDWHNLECYLHHIDGYQGSKSKEFKLTTGRDYALINKAADILKDEYCIPAYWFQPENKGLTLSAEGRWIEPVRPLEDTPSLENRSSFI